MRFVSIDVETANSRYHSICQIGVVLFEDGKEVASERIFVDPREDFGPWQIRVHGIQPHHVAGSLIFSDRIDWLNEWLGDQAVVSHSNFDRAALSQACQFHGLPIIRCDWIDSVHVAMAAWPDMGKHGYSLASVADALGISFRHHDALEDARVCGLIVQRAMMETGLSISELLTRPMVEKSFMRGKKLSTLGRPASKRTGDGDGALLGEMIVFTGSLNVSRELAADMAAEAGGDVQDNVTKKTTMVVVGQRESMPGWLVKSGKQIKAERLIESGVRIRIVGEQDFLALAAIKD